MGGVCDVCGVVYVCGVYGWCMCVMYMGGVCV